MKKCLTILFFAALSLGVSAQQNYQPSAANLAARQDFQNRKFGLFIHWGIYSILGDAEWVMHDQKIPYKNYSRLASFFYPYGFNAKQWVSMAKAAGMKYITITARHHDGFSMFGTKASPYNIVDATPWHQDPMKALADECHKQGIKLFFYYSLLDWGRPDYGYGHKIVNGKPENASWDHYIAFMKQQLTELLTNYGPIAGIWFDGEWDREDADWHFDEIYALIHKLQPAALIENNHHHAPRAGEDIQEFERDLPGANSHGWNSGGVSRQLPLETCQTMNGSWGFNINDTMYKSVKQIVQLLVKDAGMNANLLLNVGPMPNGKIQPEFIDTLHLVGKWMDQYGQSIYGTRAGFMSPEDWGVTTQKDGRQFIHVLKYPENGLLFIRGVKRKVLSATGFISGKPVKFKQMPEGVFFYMEGMSPDANDNVIEIKLGEGAVKLPKRNKWIMKHA
ncbi:MAG TPA: alpha-L-fucosidase [Chitinophagaceae bacterium]|nr:alpha-L-fucosidase [Chitinophagaceae bacterium]